MKALDFVALPALVVTVIATTPARCAGAVVVRVVGLTIVRFAAAMPSKEAVASTAKPVPWMVTLVPPTVEPLSGLMLVIAGATLVGVAVAVAVGFGVVVGAVVGVGGRAVTVGFGVAVGAVGGGSAGVGEAKDAVGASVGVGMTPGVGVGLAGAIKV